MKMYSQVSFLLVVLALAASPLLSGCSSSHRSHGFVDHSQPHPYLQPNGLPQQKYMVAGGLLVEYPAPSDGIFFWVDQTSEKFIVSRFIEQGQWFETYIPDDLGELEQVLGIPLGQARLVVYFVPAAAFEPKNNMQN